MLTFIKSHNILRKHVSKGSFKSARILNENLVMVYHKPETVLLNRFPFVGACILGK